MKTRFNFISLILLLLMACATQAQTVPALVNYQGRLANPDGTALATQDYTLTFRVYDSATNSGGLVWGPQVFDGVVGQGHGGKIPVVQGYFNVMLGPEDINTNSLANAFNATNRFVEIQVGTNNPILPRQQILSAPFAFQAANSTTLAGYDWSALLGTNNPAAGQIQASKIADGAVSFLKTAARQVATNFSGIGGIVRSVPLTNAFTVESPTISTEYPITNLVVTLLTRGNPVVLEPTMFDTSSSSSIQADRPPGTTSLTFHYYRNGQKIIAVNTADSGTVLRSSPANYRHIDFPPAGTNKYEIRIQTGGTGTSSFTIQNIQLVAFEL